MSFTDSAKKLIQYWFEKGISEGSWDDGTKFFYFYLCLNVAMANLSNENSDKKMLDWTKKNNSPIKEAFLRRLEYDPFLEQLKRLKSFCPINDARSSSSKQRNISDIHNMDQALEVIYLIRCNFFHGNKPPSIGRNKHIIESTTHILKYWMEVIYTSRT